MLGEQYLATRRELADLTSAIRELAQNTNTSNDEISAGNVRDYLESPLRFVVCGEPSAGKTAFLEGLLNLKLGSGNQIDIYGSSVLWTGGRVEHAEYSQRREIGEVEVVDSTGISQLGDGEMSERIALHQSQRADKNWRTLEEPVLLADLLLAESTVDNCILVDCLTLWLSNCLFHPDLHALNRSRNARSGSYV